MLEKTHNILSTLSVCEQNCNAAPAVRQLAGRSEDINIDMYF